MKNSNKGWKNTIDSDIYRLYGIQSLHSPPFFLLFGDILPNVSTRVVSWEWERRFRTQSRPSFHLFNLWSCEYCVNVCGRKNPCQLRWEMIEWIPFFTSKCSAWMRESGVCIPVRWLTLSLCFPFLFSRPLLLLLLYPLLSSGPTSAQFQSESRLYYIILCVDLG